MKGTKGISALITFTMILTFLLLIRDFSVPADSVASPTEVFEDNDYSLEEMLILALQDERYAQAEYKLILQIYEANRDFANMAIEEGLHADHLLGLFDKYNLKVPEDKSNLKTVVPNNLEEAYKIASLLESNNIRMYNTFLLRNDLPDDVKEIFTHLVKASSIHSLELDNILEYHY